MGGRNTYAAGRQVPFRWKTVGLFRGIKILQGTGGLHKLPEEAHTSRAYVLLYPDGNLQMLRFYDEDHFLTTEIGFHPEPGLTGHRNPVYHIHAYTREFHRSNPRLFTAEDMKLFGQYLTVKGHLQ